METLEDLGGRPHFELRHQPGQPTRIARSQRRLVCSSQGRLAVSDIVVRGDSVPESVRRSMELWVGCIAGALEEGSCREKLAGAGFEHVDVEATRIYHSDDARALLGEAGRSDESALAQIDGRFMIAFVRARKPLAATKSCCA